MDNQQLIKRIEALEKWKNDRIRQQITFPLDFQSQEILSKYLMRINQEVIVVGGAAGTESTYYIGNQANFDFQVSKNTFIPYTASTSTDRLTVTGVYFDNNTQVYVSTSDTTPTPLVAGVGYWVRDSTGTTFKLSATMGGAAINITTTGVGRQYIYYF